MSKQCELCRSSFQMFSGDKEMLAKFEVPEPELCPLCRHQLRAMFMPTPLEMVPGYYQAQ